MISLDRVTRQVGARRLLDEVSLEIGAGDRVGIVGPNGAGKTTLVRLVLGIDVPDTGTVTIARGASVGHLPQEALPETDRTPLDVALEPGAHIAPLLSAIARVEHQLEAAATGSSTDALDLQHRLADELAALHDRLRQHGGHEREPRARRTLAGLGFEPAEMTNPLSTFSGGWIMRAALARLLAEPPDLLVLDEPTNHLDLEAVLWFQDHLVRHEGTLVVVSHDRGFLDTVVSQIIEVDRGQLTRYRGNYGDYRRQREERAAQRLAAADAQARRRRETERFIERFRAKATKARQVQSRIKALEREESIEVERKAATIGFHFPQPARTSRVTLELERVSKSWDDKVLYRALDLVVERGERIALIGPNGAGKSTLLGLLAGTVAPDTGQRRIGLGVRTALYTQHRTDMLDLSSTVLDNARAVGAAIGETRLRTLLGAFLFRGDDVDKPVAVLSGGEKSRLALALLLLDPPSVLLMDEPTIHLDIESVDALIEALGAFEGTLCFVSHDQHFIRSLASRVIRIDHGAFEDHRGDWAAWEWRQSQRAGNRPERREPAQTHAVPAGEKNREASLPARAPGSRRDEKRRAAERRNELSRRTRELRREFEQVEAEIAGIEAEKIALETRLIDPAALAGAKGGELLRAHAEAARTLATAMDRWAVLGQTIEEITATIETGPDVA